MFAAKDVVRYKLAVDLEQHLQENDGGNQAPASQSSQASAATQVVGWRFKGSRAVVTGVDKIEDNIGDTICTIQMQV